MPTTDKRVDEYSELTSLANDDSIMTIDTSDTSDSVLGTLKRLLPTTLLTHLQGALSLGWSRITSTPTTLSGYGITDAASDSELSTHEADTTNVHGIADTTALLTTAAIGVTVQAYDPGIAVLLGSIYH